MSNSKKDPDYWKKRYNADIERSRLFARVSARDNYAKRRDSLLVRAKIRQQRIRLDAMGALGGPTCTRCGFSDIRALQIDHINGGGTVDSKSRCWYKRYTSIIKGATGFQVLCANCNWIKKSERGEV